MLPSAFRNHAEGSSRFNIRTLRFVSDGQMYSSFTRGSSLNMVPKACSLKPGSPYLQLTTELLPLEPEHDSLWRLLSLVANALPSRPEHARSRTFLGYCVCELPLRRSPD